MPQLVGKVIKVLEPVSGEKDGKAWVRVQFVVTTTDSNPKIVAFDAFGDERVAQVSSLQTAQTVIVEYMPESHEFGEKFYTSLRCYRVSIAQAVQQNKEG